MAVPLSALQDTAAALKRNDSSFDAWHRLCGKETAGNALTKRKRHGALLHTFGAAALLGIEMILSGLACHELALAGHPDPLGV